MGKPTLQEYDVSKCCLVKMTSHWLATAISYKSRPASNPNSVEADSLVRPPVRSSGKTSPLA